MFSLSFYRWIFHCIFIVYMDNFSNMILESKIGMNFVEQF